MKGLSFQNRYARLRHIENMARPHLDALLEIIRRHSEFLDGNLFFVNLSEAERGEASDDLLEKRANLVALIRGRDRVLEIGFNAGHSALLMLLANDDCSVTAIDTCQHPYTLPCFSYLDDCFPGRLRLIEGDSVQIMGQLDESGFDLIHYDGGKEKTIEADLRNTRSLVGDEHVLVIDDTQNERLSTIVDDLVRQGLIEVDRHRVLYQNTHRHPWRHIIASFVNSVDRQTTRDVLRHLGSVYDHEIYPSIYTNKREIDQVAGFWRALSLVEALRRAAPLSGDFVECGVAAGHSSLIAALCLQSAGHAGRDMYLYDTYQGFCFNLDDEKDMDGKSIREYDLSQYCTEHTTVDSVLNKILSSGIDSSRVKPVVGLVEDTIPKVTPSSIAVLRLDVDLYEPTLHCLQHLYPLLVEGGYLIIDDYGHWQGCRQAVDEYFTLHELDLCELLYIDYTCRVYKKRARKQMGLTQKEKHGSAVLKGSGGGAWDENTHNSLYPDNFNEGLGRFIAERISPKTFLEFGSGMGYLAKYICNHGDVEKAICIEPYVSSELYEGIPRLELVHANIFERKPEQVIGQRFDLVLSIEVAEHVDRPDHDYLFDYLVAHTSKWVVFSAGRIGQGGFGHIAERTEEDWKFEFLKRSMNFDEELTAEIRSFSDSKNVNHKRNLMVFRREASVFEGLSVVEEIDSFRDHYLSLDYLPVCKAAVEEQRVLLNERADEISALHAQIEKLQRRSSLADRQKETIDCILKKRDKIVKERNRLRHELEVIKSTWVYRFLLKNKMDRK